MAKRMFGVALLGMLLVIFQGLKPVGSEPFQAATQAPVRYEGSPLPDKFAPDGGLRPVVGVHSSQVLRATRARPDLADGRGWTYNHAPMLAYWKGNFYLEFISSPVDEHGFPVDACVIRSRDGREWSKPVVAFPAWKSDAAGGPRQSIVHQRMGFFAAPNGRLLVVSHYGGENDAFEGPGDVVREIYHDGSFGPIHFLRFGPGWKEVNAFHPLYSRAPDAGFVEACNALLHNPFVSDQLFELMRGFPAGAYIAIAEPYDPKEERKALSFFHRRDGNVVALWKKAWTALSVDGGKSWSKPVQAPGIARTFAKLWGQRTEDGRYAIVYDPQDHPPGNRWPMAVITGDDGESFRNMLMLHGEVPLRRYGGKAKDIGPQYYRGIVEGDGDPPGTEMWLAYSVNKEDLWVSRVPVPVRSSVEAPVNDNFDDMEPGGVREWNIYSPRWAPVDIAPSPDGTGKCLRLEDGDPYDYGRAVRVFPAAQSSVVEFSVMPMNGRPGRLEIELLDAQGRRPIRVWLTEHGRIQALDGIRARDLSALNPGRWVKIRIEASVAGREYALSIDGNALLKGQFAEAAADLERLSLRTGGYRGIDRGQAGRQDPEDGPPDEIKYFVGTIDPETDRPIRPAVFLIDSVRAGR